MNSTPQIIRADVLGFCMGVRRAVEAAENDLTDISKDSQKNSSAAKVYTFGPLIHNKTVLQNLADAGVEVLDEQSIQTDSEFTQNLQNAVVIIRAHGIPPKIRRRLEELQTRIIDATCPRVIANQRRAEAFSRKGFTVILAGDRSHGEIAAIKGCAEEDGGRCIIVENSAEAEELAHDRSSLPEKAVLISQTTIKEEEYEAILSVLRAHIPDLTVCKTICPATQERQQALRDLANKTDGILVVGSKGSANTQRLFNTAAELCPHAALIESPTEIPEIFYAFEKIGITAGASTPDSAIDAVEKALKKGYYEE
jgi:4-hydroxy-3-methylbut-2-enyl diphosphate reductase